jgi:signal transduction histidine kinase
LQEFIATHRDDLVARTTARLHPRSGPSAARYPIDHGVPAFLLQLAETLRLASALRPVNGAASSIASTAARHGAELHAAGWSVSQAVHEYGSIGAAITELAAEQRAPITVEEFHTLNRCLNTAIAAAVTEHVRLTAQQQADGEVEHCGHAAHELRDLLNGAVLAFHALKAGAPVGGSAGAVLDRSLTHLKNLIDGMLDDVRSAADHHRRQSLSVGTLLGEVGAEGALEGDSRHIRFSVLPVDPALAVVADPQLIHSAVMNLVHNAFKNTQPGGAVTVRASADGNRLRLEVQDQCGGLPDGRHDIFKAFGERSGHDKSGLGLGLSMARQAARAHGGDVHVRNLPGEGCVFAIDLPLESSDVHVAPSA